QTCANGVITSCDATGTLTMSTCTTGCATDGRACSKMIPSNDLETYFDMTPAPPNLDLEDGSLEVDASMFYSNDGVTVTPVSSFDVPAPANGAPLRVFVVDHLTLGNIVIYSTTGNGGGGGAGGGIGRAVAFLATDDIDLLGTVSIRTGGLAQANCAGTAGAYVDDVGTKVYVAGAGGGGSVTAGADGGPIRASNGGITEVAGNGGTALNSNPTLEPLVGG